MHKHALYIYVCIYIHVSIHIQNVYEMIVSYNSVHCSHSSRILWLHKAITDFIITFTDAKRREVSTTTDS